MTLCNPYSWPWIKGWLRETRQREGRELAYKLMARHGPYEIMRYANDNLKMAAATGNQRDLYTYLGVAAAARERVQEENQHVG